MPDGSCPESTADQARRCWEVEENWRALFLPGPIPFEATGVLSALAVPLADAGIPIFAISTYDTDYVLVRAKNLERALHVLHADPERQRIASGSPYEPVIGFSRAVRAGDRVLVSRQGTGRGGNARSVMIASGRRGDLSIEIARLIWRFGGGVMLSSRKPGAQHHTPGAPCFREAPQPTRAISAAPRSIPRP
jgi:hypothetical protein